ncbi:MAG: S-methyl-5-thioribose-1-phosphate isomerase [Nitrososphaerales archaeon]
MKGFEELRTIKLEDDKVIMIDQTKLPHRLEFYECYTPEQVAEAIKKMIVRGAPAIGVAAAMGMALGAKLAAKNGRNVREELERVGKMMIGTRPTAANIAWAVNRIMKLTKENSDDKLLKLITREVNLMAEEDIERNKMIGVYGSKLIEDGDVILTHCNAGSLATVGYGTALGILRKAREEGKCFRVMACESRPALQGSRLTAFELKEDGFDVSLITDSMVGYVMSNSRVTKVLVGADRILSNGYVFNKIGTYQIAVLANRHNIPFYVAAPSSSFDLQHNYDEIEIEERSYDEVIQIGGVKIAPEGVNVLNPAFDLTPPELITAIICEKAIIYPPYDKNIRLTLLEK